MWPSFFTLAVFVVVCFCSSPPSFLLVLLLPLLFSLAAVAGGAGHGEIPLQHGNQHALQRGQAKDWNYYMGILDGRVVMLIDDRRESFCSLGYIDLLQTLRP